jgi:hypothetical protein
MSPATLEFYRSMSPYELLELINSSASTGADFIAIYISLLSAYLLVAYYFGGKLSSIELVLFSSMYSAFCLALVSGTYQALNGMVIILKFVQTIDNSLTLLLMILVMALSWMLSIVFMVKRWRLR